MFKTVLLTLVAGAAAFAPGPAFVPRSSALFMSAELELKVKNIIVEQLGVDADKVVGSASFIDDLGADSLDTVELIMAIEEEFDTEIPEEEAASIATVQDAINFVIKL
jgi:acyl carrier protein